MKLLAALLQIIGVLVVPLAVAGLWGFWWGLLVLGLVAWGSGFAIERELA